MLVIGGKVGYCVALFYAVLDGHHRYYALLELGKKQVDCALAGDFSSLMFYMTEQGYFQPKPETEEENQKKIIHLHENIQDFLQNFLKDPTKAKPPNKKKSNWSFFKEKLDLQSSS